MYRLVALTSRHWKPLLVLNAVLLSLTALKIVISPPYWRATAELIVPPSSGLADSGSALRSPDDAQGDVDAGTVAVPPSAVSDIITSNETLSAVRDVDPQLVQRDSELSEYRELFRTLHDADSTVIGLLVEGASPDIAVERTQLLLDAFFGRLDELRQSYADDRIVLLQARLERAEANLQAARLNIEEFQSQTSTIATGEGSVDAASALSELTTSLAQANTQAQASEERARELSQSLGVTAGQAMELLASTSTPTVTALRARLTEIDASLLQIDERFLADSLTSRALQQEREDVILRLNAALTGDELVARNAAVFVREDATVLLQELVSANNQAYAQKQQANALQNEVERLSNQLTNLPENQARATELNQQLATAERVYNGLIAQIEDVDLGAASLYPVVQILEQPYVGQERSGPSRRNMAVAGAIASVVSSAVLVSLLEGRNPLLAPSDIQTTDIPVLETVPKLDLLFGRQVPLLKSTPEFQWLASDIESFALERKHIMITSADAGEGKTSTALGLAMALASLGLRVLLVDGDFHKGELSHKLGFLWLDVDTPIPHSLADIDVRPVSIEPGLDLLASYPIEDGVTRFVAQGEFSDYVQRAAATGTYDYVLVDGAPIGLTSDAVLMAREIGNVLMIVRPGTSNLYPFRNAISQLQRYGANVLGIVVNGKVTSTSDYMYRYQLPARLPS